MAQLILVIVGWVVMMTWRLFKVGVFVSVIWGAITNLTETDLVGIGDFVSWAKLLDPDFFGSVFFSWIAENWLTCGIAILLWNSLNIRWSLRELSETGGYTRIFIGTVMNYFEIATETPSMKNFRTKGVWSTIKEGLAELVATRILGFATPYDDRLDAQAVRHGGAVHFADDVKAAIRKA